MYVVKSDILEAKEGNGTNEKTNVNVMHQIMCYLTGNYLSMLKYIFWQFYIIKKSKNVIIKLLTECLTCTPF